MDTSEENHWLIVNETKFNNFVLKIELMIYFPCSAIYVPYSGRRNRAGELHKGVDTDKRLPFFKRKYIVGDTATPMRQALLLAAL